METEITILNKIPGLANGMIEFDYDEIGDVLYSKIKRHPMPFDLDLDGGVVLSLDPESYQIIGFMIIDYSWRIKNKKLGTIPFIDYKQLPTVQ